MDIEPHRARRARVLDAMAERGGGIAIHVNAPERIRNRDAEVSSLSGIPAFPSVVWTRSSESSRNPSSSSWVKLTHGEEAGHV